MDYFELTFRFDDQDNSLTRFEGLSIEDLMRFLKALDGAISSNNHLVLSEIKGNCYAPVISTPVKTEFEEIKSLHSEIERGNYNSLNKGGKSYFRYISNLLDKGITFSIYDQGKDFYKNIETLPIRKNYPYLYNTNQITGVLTQIGSRNLQSKNIIFVDSYPIEIKISHTQEEQLKDYFKAQKVVFNITEKVNKETGKLEQAELDDFAILKAEKSIYETIDAVREHHGDYFATRLNKSSYGE